MDEEERRLAALHFVEDVGLFFARAGLPRMAGRILGWLLIADPPHQCPGDLAAALQASKGSISTMTRLLIQLGAVERVARPGDRRDYYRIPAGVWSRLLRERLAEVQAFRLLAERGLGLLAGRDPGVRERLEEVRDLYAFCERELPPLIDRWEQEQGRPSIVTAKGVSRS